MNLSKIYTQSLIPPFFQNLLGAVGDNNDFAASRIRLVFLIVLGAFILITMYYASRAAWKYLRSQGEQSQIDEATKAIEAIAMGLGALLVSIVGIVLLLVFFGADLLNTNIYETCIDGPNSHGCYSCEAEDGGLPEGWSSLREEVENPELEAGKKVSKGVSYGTGTDISKQQICIFCEWEYYHYSEKDGFINKEAEIVCK